MKLESIKGEKFTSFKPNKLCNLAAIVGGANTPTEYKYSAAADYSYTARTPNDDGCWTLVSEGDTVISKPKGVDCK